MFDELKSWNGSRIQRCEDRNKAMDGKGFVAKAEWKEGEDIPNFPAQKLVRMSPEFHDPLVAIVHAFDMDEEIRKNLPKDTKISLDVLFVKNDGNFVPVDKNFLASWSGFHD